MPRISMTDFVDIVSKSGTPKTTKVAEVKNRRPYEPAFDFYRLIRETIIEAHENGQPRSAIESVLEILTDRKKITAYPDLVMGYTKWWGRKTLDWFEPPTAFFSAHGVDVSVNPELGLTINGQPHLVKLYFKAPKLAKNRIDIITHLMEVALTDECPKGTAMAVLDVRRSKLIRPTVAIPTLDATLIAELAYVAALWPRV